VDKGVSGSKGRDGRPQFDKLLKAASRREFDMIAKAAGCGVSTVQRILAEQPA
jgi:DNA invertase Pin-like site-specific DNA recombinase